MSGRRPRAVALAILAAGLGAAASLMWGGYRTPPTVLAVTFVLTLAVGWSFAGLGVVAWVRWPGSRTGVLMIAVGLAWFARAVGAVEDPVAFSVGVLIGSVYLAVLAHLIVTYPSGRVVSRAQWLVVVAAYLCTVPVNLVGHWLLTGTGTCRDCPFNLLVPDTRVVAPDAGHQVLFVLLASVTVAVLLVTARRWHAESRASLRSLAPALWGAVTILGVIVVHRVVVLVDVAESMSAVLAWSVQVALVLWPLGLLAGMARARLDRSAVADLVVELGTALPPGAMRNALAGTLHDPSLQLVYWLPDRQVFVDAIGTEVDPPGGHDGRAVTTLTRDGHLIAALIHDPALLDHPAIMSAVAAAAGLAVENQHLHALARTHLAEIRASRTRIVAAADAERRRVERNLHDGAQQRMLNLMLALRLAKVRLGAGSCADADAALDEATGELTLALAELRDLARGIHPVILSQSGLSAAVRALAQRCSVPVRITDTLSDRRFCAAVEETAYFVVSEALANVAKHAHAAEAVVCLRHLNQDVFIDVTDDGVGGAHLQGRGGLRGLQDRVEAYSGHISVTSAVGEGTRVTAALPCG
jgi:signal transduction histidine kinase